MAGIRWTVNSGSIALASAAAKTFQTITAATNVRALIKSVSVGCQGTSETDAPILFEILHASADFTVSTTANNPVKANLSDQETLQTTGKKWTSGGTEPTFSPATGIWAMPFHPQAGLIVPVTALFGPDGLPVQGGTIVGFRLTPPGAITYTAFVSITGEE